MITTQAEKKGKKQRETLNSYFVQMNNTLKGWQPKVHILNRFINDLTEELRLAYFYTSNEHAEDLVQIEKLLRRDIDYVRDNEYIDYIKFILEKWHPELISQKRYIRFVYQVLELDKEPYESEITFTAKSKQKEEVVKTVSAQPENIKLYQYINPEFHDYTTVSDSKQNK